MLTKIETCERRWFVPGKRSHCHRGIYWNQSSWRAKSEVKIQIVLETGFTSTKLKGEQWNLQDFNIRAIDNKENQDKLVNLVSLNESQWKKSLVCCFLENSVHFLLILQGSLVVRNNYTLWHFACSFYIFFSGPSATQINWGGRSHPSLTPKRQPLIERVKNSLYLLIEEPEPE